MKEELFPTNDPPLSWERMHQNFEQRWPEEYFNPEKAKGRPLQPGQKSIYGNPWAGNAPLFPTNDEPPLQGSSRRPLSLPPGKNEPPGDEPMPKPIKPTGEGVFSENESPFPSPFSDVGKYIPKAPSSKPEPNDALKFWEHPSPIKVIPIREGKASGDVIAALQARGFKLTPVDYDPFANGQRMRVAGDVVPFPRPKNEDADRIWNQPPFKKGGFLNNPTSLINPKVNILQPNPDEPK